MLLTQKKADILSEILAVDAERGKVLLALDPIEALAQINALGNDFTLDEIKEFGEALKVASQQCELDADALDSIAGGVVVTYPFKFIALAHIW